MQKCLAMRKGHVADFAVGLWPVQVFCTSYSAQVSLRKCHCASALRKLLCASLHIAARECPAQVSLGKLRFSSRSCKSALPVLLSHLKLAIFKLQLRGVDFAHYLCLRVTAFACEARPRTRGDRGPRPAGPGSRRASHETTRRASTAENAKKKNLEFLQLDHADPGRGSREHRRKHQKTGGVLHLDQADPRRGSRVFAPRPRRSPKRAARACNDSHDSLHLPPALAMTLMMMTLMMMTLMMMTLMMVTLMMVTLMIMTPCMMTP